MNELLRRILFLPEQASSVARSIDELHYFVILVTMLGATAVTIAGGFLLLRWRRKKGDDPTLGRPEGATRPPLWLEGVVLAGLGILFVGWWGLGVRQFAMLRVPPAGAMDVYVTAKQWMWKFAYPTGQASIAVLVVPVGRPVRLVMTSRDVIHSFYVPSFRIKQDVVPGRTVTAWFEATAPGRYPILCTEYCGAGHSTMRGEVVALSPSDYDRWLADIPEDPIAAAPYVAPAVGGEPPREYLSLVDMGRRAVAAHGCLRCHTTDGTPHIGPTFAGLLGRETPLEGGGRIIADEAYVTKSIMDPGNEIHAGFPNVMPSFHGRIAAPEVASILELLRSLSTVPVTAPIEPRFAPPNVPDTGAEKGTP